MKFNHIGILTPSLEDAMEGFRTFPGWEEKKWLIRELKLPAEANQAGGSVHIRTAIADMSGVEYELIQPMDPNSYHAQELKKKGMCLHHTAYVCLDDHKEAVESQLARGGKIVMEIHVGKMHPIYVESADGGQIWEFLNYEPEPPLD